MKSTEFLTESKLFNHEFMKRIRLPVKINRDYEIPYLGGTSFDRKRIYLDKHLPRTINGISITKYIIVHEKVESSLMDEFNLSYEDAHKIANALEKKAVEKDGISWKEYSDALTPYIKKDDKETLANAPKDLDLKPYIDEKDREKFQ